MLDDDSSVAVASDEDVALPPSLIFFVGGGASFSVPLLSMVLSAVLLVPDILVLSAPTMGVLGIAAAPTTDQPPFIGMASIRFNFAKHYWRFVLAGNATLQR